ncbi:MAG: iron-containing alcohol dehydrogenase [Candidatus Dormibacteraceae bacterium]
MTDALRGTFTYSNPQVIHWGSGSVSALAQELARLHAQRIALVTTASLVAEEHAGVVKRALGDALVAVTLVVSQHSPIAQVNDAIERTAAAQVDGVVSFGGGSAIDAAKMIAVRHADRDGRAARGLPHIAVPTTLSVAELAAGAGYTDEAGNKAGARDPRQLPDAVIYDATLAIGTPLDLWLSTGIRALDHAVEGFLVEGRHPFSDVMALEAIRRLFDSLPRAKSAPRDVDVRTENQLAAWFSYTLTASASGLSHTMGKQIGARHGIPHGVTSCLLLPHVMRYLERRMPDRMALIAEATGPDPAGRVQGLIGSLGLPQHIAAYDIGEPELRKAAAELAGKYPAEDLTKIYLAAL